MDFDNIASQVIVALISGVVGYVLKKVDEVKKLRQDLNAAFCKIRKLEKHCGLDTSENGHERDVEDPQRKIHGKDAGPRP